MTDRLQEVLDRVTRVRGVRGALLVGVDDGLVVADAVMEGVRANAVAALAASLVQRMARATGTSGIGQPGFLHLEAERGALLMLAVRERLVLVAVAEPGVNVGLVRLELLRGGAEVR